MSSHWYRYECTHCGCKDYTPRHKQGRKAWPTGRAPEGTNRGPTRDYEALSGSMVSTGIVGVTKGGCGILTVAEYVCYHQC